MPHMVEWVRVVGRVMDPSPRGQEIVVPESTQCGCL